MYRQLGHDRRSAAKFFRVTPRTMLNWEAGRTAIPFPAFKLLRLMLRSELPGKDWQGWCFNQGTLWSPEGHGYTPRDFGWLSQTIRQARLFSVLYRERCALRLELQAAKVEAAQPRRPRLLPRVTSASSNWRSTAGCRAMPGVNDGEFSAWSLRARPWWATAPRVLLAQVRLHFGQQPRRMRPGSAGRSQCGPRFAPKPLQRTMPSVRWPEQL